MKISFNWLKDYVDLSGVTQQQIAETLPMLGLEVEGVEVLGLKPLKNVVVGEILSREKHPNADKLGVCMVRVGLDREPLQIVCGATNYKVGDRVPVALDGAELPTEDGGSFKIKKSKLRDVDSNGMMCSAKELGLGADHGGLLILSARPEVGTPINDVFTDTDVRFEIELTANRGDCLSHIGVARELAAKLGLTLKKPALKTPANYADVSQSPLLDSVTLETPDCPLYTAVCIKGVKVAESPEWLKKRLEAVGLRPINNVVDVTNYVMFEYGQPLHAFDAAKLRGKKISVRHAKDAEKFETLDGKTHTLNADNTVICDAEGAIALAGVMGGKNSEVEASTADIVLESAYFKPGNVRATSRRLIINTDSSYRFARDVDPQGVFDASRRAADLITELAGGTVQGATLLAGKAPRADRTIDIALSYIIDRLGFDVEAASVKKVFEDLGFFAKLDGGNFKVTVPSFRSEVDRPIDLVEEFIRIYGSDKIPEKSVLSAGCVRNDDQLYAYERKAADFLSALGFNECRHYTLRDGAELKRRYENAEFLKLANPLTSDQDSLRPSLLDGLLDAVSLNLDNGNAFKGFFENGRVFRASSGKLTELSSTAFAFVLDAADASWLKREAADFFTAKKIACDIMGLLGAALSRLVFKRADGAFWLASHAAQCGAIEREGFEARFGAVSFDILKEKKIEKIVFAGEISFKTDILYRKKAVEKFAPFGNFPPADRDVAVIVPEDAAAADVAFEISKIAKAKAKGKFELEGVNIFDAYKGTGLPEGTKSLAFSLRFRSESKTLQTEEVSGVFEAVCQEISKKYKLRV